MMIKSNINIFFLFLFLTFLFRFFGLFPSVIDHDESTYFVIGQGIANGKLLYADLVDIKPPGIFYIYAVIIHIFGNSITAARIFMILIISLTALFIFKIKETFFPDKKSSAAAGILYIIFVSTWSFYGSSVNTEIVFNFFTAFALYILFQNKQTVNYIAAGFILGLGFTIKYVVLFDFAAFLIFFLILTFKNNQNNLFKTAVNTIISGLFFLLPFAFLNLVWYFKGSYDEFFYISFIAPGNYVVHWDLIRITKFIGDFHLRFFPFVFFFYYVLLKKGSYYGENKHIKILMILWIAFDFTAILLPGNDFAHYFIQMMLPLSIFGGIFFSDQFKKPRIISFLIQKRIGYPILVLYTLLVLINQKKDYYDKPDYPEQISDYINSNTTSDDRIYTANYQHIIYFLTNKQSPTKYVHRTLLFNDRHIKALHINREEEFEKIKLSDPLYIVTQEPFEEELFRQFISANYKVDTVFNESVFVYKRCQY